MGFAKDSGYTPLTVEAIMLSVMANVNTQFGTTYTAETFIGTNFYKYFYALVQRLQASEVKTSEIFAKLQDYFNVTNERISRPVVTNPGLIEKLFDEGYTASIKKPILADAGKVYICVDTDDGTHASATVTITSYANLVSGTDDAITVNGTAFTAQVGAATLGTGTFQAATSNTASATSLALQINNHATVSASVHARAVGAIVYLRARSGGTAGNTLTLAYTDNDTNIGATKSGTLFTGGTTTAAFTTVKAAIAEIIKDSTIAGVITQGSHSSAIVLSNGQSFDFAFSTPNKIPIKLKLTTTLSENNLVVVSNPDDVKALLIANIVAKYQLGKNFEPQTYFTIVDAPYASSVLLEWSLDGGTVWYSTIYDADFDDIFTFDLADISLVEL